MDKRLVINGVEYIRFDEIKKLTVISHHHLSLVAAFDEEPEKKLEQGIVLHVIEK